MAEVKKTNNRTSSARKSASGKSGSGRTTSTRSGSARTASTKSGAGNRKSVATRQNTARVRQNASADARIAARRKEQRMRELKRKRNRMIAIIAVVLVAVVIGIVLLVRVLGSTFAAKATESTVTVNSNGTIRLEEVVDLTAVDSTEDELKDYVKSVVNEYNEENDAGDVKAVRFSTVNDTDAYVETKYGSADVYQDFSGYEFFTGTIEEAQNSGYSFESSFVSVEDGAKGESQEPSEVTSDTSLNVVIIRENIDVKVPGTILYVTDGSTTVTAEDTVQIQQADGNEDATDLIYIIYK